MIENDRLYEHHALTFHKIGVPVYKIMVRRQTVFCVQLLNMIKNDNNVWWLMNYEKVIGTKTTVKGHSGPVNTTPRLGRVDVKWIMITAECLIQQEFLLVMPVS